MWLLAYVTNRGNVINGIVALLALSLGSATAHDASDLDGAWYQSLRDAGGISCCSMQRDCHPVDVYDPSKTPGGYEVQLDGVMVDVPPRAVLQRADNPTGHAVICVGYRDGVPYARCFIRPSES